MTMPQHHFIVDRVLNLAHRGASYDAPENTLPAFRLAADMGADGVELDVQLSKDGIAVIIHDFSVDKTTNGQGNVKDKTLDELKSLDAGSNFSAEFSDTRVPTLDELFAALGPVLLFNVELKTADYTDQGLEVEVIRLIEDYQLQDRVILSSFNPFSLWRARRINNRIKRGLLWYPDSPWHLRHQLFRGLAKPHFFHPHWQATTPQMITKEHHRHIPVNVWTCNDQADMHRLIKMGVDSIMTDRPDVLSQVLKDSKPT
ncbi:MAG: glycerophosphodiester phosphodiesterase [Chloroflexota bacterium]